MEIKLDDKTWEKINNILHKNKQNWRGKENEKKLFIEAVLYLLKEKKESGDNTLQLKWGVLPKEYGNPASQSRKFNRWCQQGVWEKILPVLIHKKKYKWICELGIYECFIRESKLARDINKIIKKQYEKEIKSLKEDINKLLSEKRKMSNYIKKHMIKR